MSSLPKIILAIDDLRLLRMEFQPTFPQSLSDGLPHFLGLPFCSAVNDDIIGVSLKWNLRVVHAKPSIQCKVEKQIRQKWANHASYTKGNFEFERILTGWRGIPSVLDLRLKR
jgi:hypothetical protein